MIRNLLIALGLIAGTSAFAQHGARYGYESQKCESLDERTKNCDFGYDATLVQFDYQISRSSCVEGSTFWIRGSQVTVAHGCRAFFRVYRRPLEARVRCESHNDRPASCNLSQFGQVLNVTIRPGDKLSDARCVQNDDWSWNANSINVSQGCRADFTVEYRPLRYFR